jgi:murein DD-endopeptidase MepM/ murein hydrolase activator NlpD
MRRIAVAASLLLLLLGFRMREPALAAQSSSPRKSAEPPCAWGGDVGYGAGPKLADSVHRELLALIQTPAATRAVAAAALAKRRAVDAIEAWKRFRNPELVELARACLDHPDWHVVHRALLWARGLHDPELLARAAKCLDHAEPRLRERAVLTCLETFDPASASPAAELVRQRLAERIGREEDFHVRQALLALQRRVVGDLQPRELQPEPLVKLQDGLIWTPLVPHFTHLEEAAPGVRPREVEELGRESASELPIATRFTEPLLGYGREEVPRLVLQPFGKSRQDGAILHTGRDVGGCLDGAGVYALADGVVRMIASGTDMGTGLVVEHHVGDGIGDGHLVNAVYMHCGGTVYVKAGEQVAAGQLLGTMGLSWSIENGGQFAHLHLGLYPGPFQPGHNYGYKPAAGGLDDWLDPAEWLPKQLSAK